MTPVHTEAAKPNIMALKYRHRLLWVNKQSFGKIVPDHHIELGGRGEFSSRNHSNP